MIDFAGEHVAFVAGFLADGVNVNQVTLSKGWAGMDLLAEKLVGATVHQTFDTFVNVFDALFVFVVTENAEYTAKFFQGRADYLLIVGVAQQMVKFANSVMAGIADFVADIVSNSSFG
jgi:hypothetical protein